VEESAVGGQVAAAEVVPFDAFEPAAVPGSIVINRAAVIGTEKGASAVLIRQNLFDHAAGAVVDGDIRRKGAKLPPFVLFQQDRIIVAILLAAGGNALIARTGTQDSQTDCTHHG
jgi:hypothetical protein